MAQLLGARRGDSEAHDLYAAGRHEERNDADEPFSTSCQSQCTRKYVADPRIRRNDSMSVIVVRNTDDETAGSSPRRSRSKGNAAPQLAPRVIASHIEAPTTTPTRTLSCQSPPH